MTQVCISTTVKDTMMHLLCRIQNYCTIVTQVMLFSICRTSCDVHDNSRKIITNHMHVVNTNDHVVQQVTLYHCTVVTQDCLQCQY